MPTDSENRYAAPHVWNIVAKAIREERKHFVDQADSREAVAEAMDAAAQFALISIAGRFADRFEQDEGFNRESFLQKCEVSNGTD